MGLFRSGNVSTEEGNNFNYIPRDERAISIDRVQLSIFELHRRFQRSDIILQPFYQRRDVWTRTKKSKLIESVLLNIPVPSVYFSETDDGKWEVVDGQQRLRAFFDFLNGNYSLSRLTVLSELNNMFFGKLGSYQRKLEDYQLFIFIIKKESHPDIRFDVFERINEGATQLNAQELRNSIYRGDRINFLTRLTKNRHFIHATYGKLNAKRLKDQEAVLRFISFYTRGYEEYNGNLNSFLNATLEQFEQLVPNLESMQQIFDNTFKCIVMVFGSNSFIKSDVQRRRMNMSLFDILTYSFAKYPIASLEQKTNCIVSALENLIEEDDSFRQAITSNTLTRSSVEYRFHTWLAVYTQFTE